MHMCVMCHAFMNLLLHFISSRIQTPAILLVLTVSSAPPAMAICSVPYCGKNVCARWPQYCTYSHYLEGTGQRDEDLFPTCAFEGFFCFASCIHIYLHNHCVGRYTSGGYRIVGECLFVLHHLCTSVCVCVFPNAGCNRTPRTPYTPCCSYTCMSAHMPGVELLGDFPICVVPDCNKKRGDPYYGAKFFDFITYLIYLIHSGGNRLCFF